MNATDDPSFARLLEEIPTRRMQRRLARCIPQLDFTDGSPPRFLFVSGRCNRCNPEGVECLYFAEEERTADLEYRRRWRGTPAENQPKLTYFARVSLKRIVDLSNAQVVKALGLSTADIFADWRSKAGSTRLQQLGLALSHQQSVSALRVPSAAARERGLKGWNVAVYLAALRPPDRLEILGKSEDPLEVFP